MDRPTLPPPIWHRPLPRIVFAFAGQRRDGGGRRGERPMIAPVIRISIGKFDPDKAAAVEGKLRESRTRLESGIRAMRGNLAYYVGIDHTNHAMHNVSVWE